MASNKKNISKEAEAAISADIMNTSRARQRAAEQALRWAYSPNNWKACTDIYDAYRSPSRAKVNAFNYCKRLCEEVNGFDFRIISYGVQTFSVGFRYFGKNTGAACFAYITRDYDSYCFEPANVNA